MGETDKLIRFDEETSPSKFVALIGVLFMIFSAIALFYQSDTYVSFILLGIIEIILAAVIFLSIGHIGIWKIKIPYLWWLMLIFSIVLSGIEAVAVVLDFTFPVMGVNFAYFPSLLIFLAFLIEVIHRKSEWKASELLTIIGSILAIYDCILVFWAYSDSTTFLYEDSGEVFTYGFFGLIAIIILLLTYQKWFDIRIPFTWWGLLTVGFFLFVTVSPIASWQAGFKDVQAGGFGGAILLIAFMLKLQDY